LTSKEQDRQKEYRRESLFPWHRWGPYVSERAWGTVREDYSDNGDPWNYFPHGSAPSKAYRWGEDGIAGWCDRYQVLVFSPVFWNGRDPILKERLFGLSSTEGNHGEDVKECYFYLDGTPTHSYMKYLYKYPQGEFPYKQLKEENQRRSTADREYELIDTGIFSENRYFDIFIEYAKESPEDTCIRIQAYNRGSDPADLHILPQLLFRNQWSWGDKRDPEPKIYQGKKKSSLLTLVADDAELLSPPTLSFDYRLGRRYLYGLTGGEAWITDNETHLFETDQGSFKDAFHRALIKKEKSINLKAHGTKACMHYHFQKIPPGGNALLLLRLTDQEMDDPLGDVAQIIEKRRAEADEFYEEIHPKEASSEERLVQRQALAGLLWSKQIYLYDVNLWLKGDNTLHPPPMTRFHIRNIHWAHLNSMRILSMPDKWEYPYFCAWDQAFHCLSLGLIDIEFAKEQLWLLLFDQFQHPNGQIPACEWEFSDLNPPVQAWAVLRLYQMEKERYGREDREFLARCYHKLLINFAWWVNKVDSEGNNIFEGGFLGLDNITVLDRSQKLFGGVKLQQSDGTGWMAMLSLNLMRIALELAHKDAVYESLAIKFFEHYIYIAHAMKKRGHRDYEMWSDRDGFFYDVMTYPNGSFTKFRVRSLVGIIPLYAVEYITAEELEKFPDFRKSCEWFIKHRPKFVENCFIEFKSGDQREFLLMVMGLNQLKRVLEYVWSPLEFRSDFGLRSLSKFHQEHPFVFEGRRVNYEPAESLERVKGGNSNWRGPVWFPTTFLLIDSLKNLGRVFQDTFKISAAEEEAISLSAMSAGFGQRLLSLFLKNAEGHRPFFGPEFPFKDDPHWRDYLLFYEYYHPETGQGLGASHQTGWAALVANLIDFQSRH
jgi:hypothetical protein